MKLNLQLKPEALKTVWSPHGDIYQDKLGVPLAAPDAARDLQMRAEAMRVRKEEKAAAKAAKRTAHTSTHTFTSRFRIPTLSTDPPPYQKRNDTSTWNYVNDPRITLSSQPVVRTARRGSDATRGASLARGEESVSIFSGSTLGP